MMMRTMATAKVKMVDMAMTRAVARCPWPESSAAVGREGQDSGFRPLPCEAVARRAVALPPSPPVDHWNSKCWLRPSTEPYTPALAMTSGPPVRPYAGQQRQTPRLLPGCLPSVLFLWGPSKWTGGRGAHELNCPEDSLAQDFSPQRPGRSIASKGRLSGWSQHLMQPWALCGQGPPAEAAQGPSLASPAQRPAHISPGRETCPDSLREPSRIQPPTWMEGTPSRCLDLKEVFPL